MIPCLEFLALENLCRLQKVYSSVFTFLIQIYGVSLLYFYIDLVVFKPSLKRWDVKIIQLLIDWLVGQGAWFGAEQRLLRVQCIQQVTRDVVCFRAFKVFGLLTGFTRILDLNFKKIFKLLYYKKTNFDYYYFKQNLYFELSKQRWYGIRKFEFEAFVQFLCSIM